jgi:hypothetical protein
MTTLSALVGTILQERQRNVMIVRVLCCANCVVHRPKDLIRWSRAERARIVASCTEFTCHCLCAIYPATSSQNGYNGISQGFHNNDFETVEKDCCGKPHHQPESTRLPGSFSSIPPTLADYIGPNRHIHASRGLTQAGTGQQQ